MDHQEICRPAAFEPFYERGHPRRPTGVQRDGAQLLRGVEKLTRSSRFRQLDPAQVVVEIKVLVVRPNRRPDWYPGLDGALTKSRIQVEPVQMQLVDIGPIRRAVEDLHDAALGGVRGMTTGTPHGRFQLAHFARGPPLPGCVALAAFTHRRLSRSALVLTATPHSWAGRSRRPERP